MDIQTRLVDIEVHFPVADNQFSSAHPSYFAYALVVALSVPVRALRVQQMLDTRQFLTGH